MCAMWRATTTMLAVVVATCVTAVPLTSHVTASGSNGHRNVIFTLADDLGFSDVGWRENTDLKEATPFLSELAETGIYLDQHYVHSVCTPTRGQFLTGRYAFRLGFSSGGVIGLQTDDHLPESEVTIAEELQKMGYRTYLAGKWHLGCARLSYLPNQRGFDRSATFWGGGVDYWTKKTSNFYDVHIDNGPNLNEDDISPNTYLEHVWDSHAAAFISEHAISHPDTPFFLYYAMQVPHSPVTAPPGTEDERPCEHITDPTRKTYCGMVLTLDQGVHKVFDALDAHRLRESTLFVFSADNGGNPSVGGYNMPLRGRKASLFEGGIRASAFLWTAELAASRQGATYAGMIHITDWVPSLLTYAQGTRWTPADGRALDGVDVLQAVFEGSESPRDEIVHNVCEGTRCPKALRSEGFKLILGQTDDEWHPIPGVRQSNGTSISDAPHGLGECDNRGRCAYLFDIATDPTETTNLYNEQPDLVARLTDRLTALEAELAPCQTCGNNDPLAREVAEKTGYWSPWLDDTQTNFSASYL